jgi:DNA-binding NtrC family response regulator
VGDHVPISVDVRVISATNKDLERLIAERLFREDLFFRINLFPLKIPDLAQRREDIPIIVKNFIERNKSKGKKNIVGITPEAMERLLIYAWPGNVRELRNAIEYASVLCPAGDIDVAHLPPKFQRSATLASPSSTPSRLINWKGND